MSLQDRFISVTPFSKSSNRDLYGDYLRIKFEVFGVELGWAILKDESGEALTREDPFDTHGRFLVAHTPDGLPVGVVRAVPLKLGFPHRDLFEHHVCQPAFAHILDRLGTVNALAVLRPYRRRKYRLSQHGWVGSIAQLMMLCLFDLMEQEGLRGAVLTAAGIISVRFFLRMGFAVIDSPAVTPLHPDTMANMGIVFGSESHVEARKNCGMALRKPGCLEQDSLSLSNYFDRCRQKAIGSRYVESFFLTTTKAG